MVQVENPLLMHCPHDDQRQLQRRLSMLSVLQQETIKLERRQRLQTSLPITMEAAPAPSLPHMTHPWSAYPSAAYIRRQPSMAASFHEVSEVVPRLE